MITLTFSTKYVIDDVLLAIADMVGALTSTAMMLNYDKKNIHVDREQISDGSIKLIKSVGLFDIVKRVREDDPLITDIVIITIADFLIDAGLELILRSRFSPHLLPNNNAVIVVTYTHKMLPNFAQVATTVDEPSEVSKALTSIGLPHQVWDGADLHFEYEWFRNVSGRFSTFFPDKGRQIVVAFEDEAEAVQFKMRWC